MNQLTHNSESLANALVSVVLPTFNRAAYIVEAVESVLAQTYLHRELIVVDDGSTDNTRELLEPYGESIDYVWQENRGLAAARNVGIRRAKGQLLAFIDSDDIWLPEKLTTQLNVLATAPETEAVYGHAEQFVSPEVAEEQRVKLQHMAGSTRPSPMACSLLIRRESFARVGPFDEQLRVGTDMEWYGRGCDANLNTVMLDDTLLRRRLHDSNLNLTHADEQGERIQVLRQLLAARRARAQSERSSENTK